MPALRGCRVPRRHFVLVGREGDQDLVLLPLGDLDEIERATKLRWDFIELGRRVTIRPDVGVLPPVVGDPDRLSQLFILLTVTPRQGARRCRSNSVASQANALFPNWFR